MSLPFSPSKAFYTQIEIAILGTMASFGFFFFLSVMGKSKFPIAK
jgi:hypothetical protein